MSNTIKTMFEQYKKPGKKKLKVVLASLLGLGTVGGLGVVGYKAINDQSSSFVSEQRSAPREMPRNYETRPAPTQSNGFSSFASSVTSKLTGKEPKKSSFVKKKKKAKAKFAKKHKGKKGKKFVKKHGKHKKKHVASKFKKHKKHKSQKTVASNGK